MTKLLLPSFFDTYPPGLEEVLALEKIMGFIEKEVYDIYVFDTAPTGHLVQLLKFPQLVREWLRVTYKGILKYQRQYRVENLETISKRIISSQTTLRIMQELLTDSQKSEFVEKTSIFFSGLCLAMDKAVEAETVVFPTPPFPPKIRN